MQDLRQQTIDVYNNNAAAMAEKFRSLPPRTKHIDAALQASVNKARPRILEIGCGDGRDARAIIEQAGWYLGIDVSKELIKLAQDYVPEANFEVTDAVTYDYPKNVDIVLAFASFLHFDKDEFAKVLNKLHASLNEQGVIYLSLKWAKEYKMETNTDQFGVRQYYFYSEESVANIAGDLFKTEDSWREEVQSANHTEWLEIILRKI